MREPEISVIVPVYNVEKYLSQCLDSILNQTFSNIEIICVNDGSKDKSGKLLEKYARKDSRIKIVVKKNGGLSSARNAGMKVARGNFYAFIDSDDWIAPDMLEKLYNNITSLNTDIAICAVRQFDEWTQKTDDSNPYYTLEYFDESFDGRAFSYKDTKPFIMDVCVTAWNKLYRRSFVDEHNAVFPDGFIFEDGPFFFSLFFNTERVSIVRDFLYFYRINRSGSIIHKAGKKFLNLIDVTEMMYNSIKDLPDFEDIKYIFYKKKVEDIIFRFENIHFKYKSAYAKKVKNESSLANKELFDLENNELNYNCRLFTYLRNGSFLYYELQKFKIKCMYKLMEILYWDESNECYTFKYKQHIFRIKKRPEILDVYYLDDKIYVILFKKIKTKFTFEYSKLEQS